MDSTDVNYYLISPNYPDSYANNGQICQTFELGNVGNILEWYLDSFKTEQDHDFLRIYAKYEDTQSIAIAK